MGAGLFIPGAKVKATTEVHYSLSVPAYKYGVRAILKLAAANTTLHNIT
jgi:hypothetical protein